jgi:hypothetical protein
MARDICFQYIMIKPETDAGIPWYHEHLAATDPATAAEWQEKVVDVVFTGNFGGLLTTADAADRIYKITPTTFEFTLITSPEQLEIYANYVFAQSSESEVMNLLYAAQDYAWEFGWWCANLAHSIEDKHTLPLPVNERIQYTTKFQP